MSEFREKEKSGVRVLSDKKTGHRTMTAVGPVARLEWLEQVQADITLGDADFRVAVALASFINSNTGYAFAGQKALGEKTRVSERSVRLRIAKLIERGHVLQNRRKASPSALYLVIQDRQEDCRSTSSQDRQEDCHSWEGQDRQTTGHSDITDIGSRPAKSAHQDRQESGSKTGKCQNWNESKSDSYDAITSRYNQATVTKDGAAAPLGAPQAPSVCDGIDADQCTSLAGSLAPLKGRSPAREIPPLINEDLPLGIYPEVSPDDEIPLVDLDFIDSPREASELIVDAPRIRPGIATRPAPEGEPPPFAGIDPSDVIAIEGEPPPTAKPATSHTTHAEGEI